MDVTYERPEVGEFREQKLEAPTRLCVRTGGRPLFEKAHDAGSAIPDPLREALANFFELRSKARIPARVRNLFLDLEDQSREFGRDAIVFAAQVFSAAGEPPATPGLDISERPKGFVEQGRCLDARPEFLGTPGREAVGMQTSAQVVVPLLQLPGFDGRVAFETQEAREIRVTRQGLYCLAVFAEERRAVDGTTTPAAESALRLQRKRRSHSFA